MQGDPIWFSSRHDKPPGTVMEVIYVMVPVCASPAYDAPGMVKQVMPGFKPVLFL